MILHTRCKEINIKVLILGSMPPPMGGVTTHIKRFLQSPKPDYVDLRVADLKSRTIYSSKGETGGFLKILVCFLQCDLLHIHISHNTKLLFAIFGKLFFKKIIYTHHNSIVNNASIFILLCKLCDSVVLVNDDNFQGAEFDNIRHKLIMIPAFIPSEDQVELPSELQCLLDEYEFIITTNCYKLTFFEEGDLYGLDLFIDAYNQLNNERKISNTLFLIIDPSGTAQCYVQERLRSQQTMNCSLVYMSEQIDFCSLLKHSTASVRATRTDGDSLSVRESLYFGTPVIASDVTRRPAGTILFKNGSSEALADGIFRVISKRRKDHCYFFPRADSDNFNSQVVQLYDAVLGRN